MFSLVGDAVLLRPLPFPDQDSIYVIQKADPLAGTHVEELAYPELVDLQESIPGFEYVAATPTSLYGYAKVLETGTADPVQLEASPVSHDFFRVLGVTPPPWAGIHRFGRTGWRTAGRCDFRSNMA